MPAQIGRDEVQRLLEEGAQLVEVLPAEMHRKERLPGAISLPLTEMDRVSEDEPFEEADGVEDTVPYIPPLASYRIKVVWGEIRQAVPHIYPDEILDEDELDGDG